MADDLKAVLLAAALPHVAFEGWSESAFAAAAADAGIAPALARGICPRGALDLALAYHAAGDAAMRAALAGADLAGKRFRDRIAHAVRLRLEGADPEVVRRGVALFALPQHAGEGARAIWGTADAIWRALGDTSDDINHYSKRAILSAVYSATVLYWLGDTAPGHAATWEFLDRRIENVMQFEKLKASARANPLFNALFAGPARLLAMVKAPQGRVQDHLPGSVK